MSVADTIDLEISITSEIVYYDGHKENGPSTEFSSQVKSYDALKQVEKLYDRTINKLTRPPFGGRFLWELGQVIQPIESDRARLKKFIVYYVEMRATLYFDDGTVDYKSHDNTYEVPVYNNIVNWNFKIED